MGEGTVRLAAESMQRMKAPLGGHAACDARFHVGRDVESKKEGRPSQGLHQGPTLTGVPRP